MGETVRKKEIRFPGGWETARKNKPISTISIQQQTEFQLQVKKDQAYFKGEISNFDAKKHSQTREKTPKRQMVPFSVVKSTQTCYKTREKKGQKSVFTHVQGHTPKGSWG